MMRIAPAGALLMLVLAAPSAGAQGKRALTFEDFVSMKSVSDPQLSPDGRRVLYLVRTADVEANRRTGKTWLADVAGGQARAFPDDTTSASEARWSPDGTRIAYVAGGQLWVSDASGGARRRLTSLNGGATGPVWAPSGDRIAFVSSVYPDCATDACNVSRDSTKAASKVKAHIADQLMYRHWNAWDEGTRAHLFVVGADGAGVRDLTAGKRYDVPPGPFGGSEGYAFSPDGREVAYTAKDAGREQAWSTDVNVYTVPVAGGEPAVITAANRAADQNPLYSPDGRFIAYASQERAGFESDRWRLMLYDRQARTSRELLPSWDRNADAYLFTADGGSIIITTVDASRDKFFRVRLDAQGRASGAPQLLTTGGNNAAASVSRDGRTIAWMQDAAHRPPEVWVGSLGAGAITGARQLTRYNDAAVAGLDLHAAEDYWFRGAERDSVQGFVIKPPNFDPSRKYPVVLLIHGGPQGAFLDNWHSRWNYQLFASTGSGVIVINPSGSTGYGQKFVDAVSRDWGGKVYTDLMNGLDEALKRNPWMDRARLGAAGGSYGGYMVNWIAGHTDRFKALVSHAGPYNLENMYAATEELWFPEWEYGGPTWDEKAMKDNYRIWSPHLFAKNFRTPTLVVHGELDYRVPYTEGLSMFTALQRQGVPSRLLVFPDEGHWIGKPQNQRLWWSEVLGWFRKHLDAAPRASR